MEFKQKNTKYLFFVFAFMVFAIFALTYNFLQMKSYNIMNKLTQNSRVASNDVVLVVIDDKSLHEIGRWPWSREYYLEIFDYFQNHTNAKLMGYDGLVMALDLEHPKSDKKFFSNIGKYDKLTAGVAFSYNDFDKEIDKNYYDNLLRTKTDVKIIDKRHKKNKIQSGFKSFTTLEKQYFENVKSLGSVNMPEDSDGYIRKAGQLYDYKGEFFPSLAFNMYSKYTGIDEFILTDKFIYGFCEKYSLKVPIENKGGFITNYISYYKTSDGVY